MMFMGHVVLILNERIMKLLTVSLNLRKSQRFMVIMSKIMDKDGKRWMERVLERTIRVTETSIKICEPSTIMYM